MEQQEKHKIEQNQTYRIVNRQTKYSLTQGPQVKANPQLKGAVSQLWLMEQVKPDYYYIIALQNSEVLTKGDSLHLEKSKLKDNQFWKIIKAEDCTQGSYYWIVDDEKETNLTISANPLFDTLKMTSRDLTLYITQWEFVLINQEQQLAGVGSLKSTFSNLVAGISDGSTKQGAYISQQYYNGRGSQRWLFQKSGKNQCFYIRSLRSGLILTPQGAIKQGAKIIQSCFNNADNQKWKLIKTKQNRYKVQLLTDQNLFLGVGNNKQETILVLWEDSQKCEWQLTSL